MVKLRKTITVRFVQYSTSQLFPLYYKILYSDQWPAKFINVLHPLLLHILVDLKVTLSSVKAKKMPAYLSLHYFFNKEYVHRSR